MLNPSIIVKEVEDYLRSGKTPSQAFEQVSKDHDIRYNDVRIVAVTAIPELWKNWSPNQRRK